jgi:hypothetical protein
VPPATACTVEDHGTVTGKPFGCGSIVLVGRLTGRRVSATFRLLLRRGSVTGGVDMPFTISGNLISFGGTAQLTAVTGAYRGIITSGPLRRWTRTRLDGQSGRLTVTGFASY